MSIIEQIKAEIERRKKEIHATIFNDEFDSLLSFLSTLESEKPVPADLEEAAWGYASKECEKAAFIAGAQWQKEQMMEEAVKMYRCYDEEHNLVGFSVDYDAPGAYGNLVSIIVKED